MRIATYALQTLERLCGVTIKSTIAHMAGSNIFNNIITFITTYILANYLSAESFGLYSVCGTFTMTLYSVAEFGLGISLISAYGRADSAHVRDAIMRSALQSRFIVSAVVIFLCFPIGILISMSNILGDISHQAISIAVASAGSISLWAFLRATLQCKQDFTGYSLNTIAYAMIRATLLLLLWSNSVTEPVLYLGCIYLIAPWLSFAKGILKISISTKALTTAPDLSITKRIFRYGAWCTSSALLYPLCYTLPLYIINRSFGAKDAAAYAVCLLFVATIAPLNDSVRAYIIPKVTAFSSCSEALTHMRKISNLAFKAISASATGAAVCVGMYAVLYSEKFPGMSASVFVLVFTISLAAYCGVMNTVLHYLNIPRLDAAINLYRVTSVGVVCLLLLPRNGPLAGAIATSVSVLSGEFILYIYLKRKLSNMCSHTC